MRMRTVIKCIVESESEARPSVLVLAGGAETASDVAGAIPSAEATAAAAADVSPSLSPGDGDTDVGRADVVVVVDAEGLDSVRGQSRACRVVALVDDPTGATATDPLVDAVATTRADLDATVRWLAARGDADRRHDEPARTPSRIEQLNAEMTRLASVRSTEEAHQTAIDVASEVFPRYHCVVGVRDEEWVEPMAASAEVAVEDCDRVRVGRGSAGAAIEDGEPVIESRSNDENPYDSVLSIPVGSDTVFQLATDEDGFDAGDRRLAALLASHVEETLDRIRVDEALRTEHEHLLALFSNIPDPAVAYDYVDGEPVVYRVNEAFEATFGYDAETVVGESIDDYVIPDETTAVREVAEINTRLQRGESVRREAARKTADGTRHFIVHVVPVRLDEDNGSGYAIYTDVTEQREREAKLREQNERLDEFASIVSHDLRNPLSVAEGYVDLASETGETAHLATAGEALDRIDELVGDLLSLARQGQSVSDTESVSLAAIGREAWQSVDTPRADLVVANDVALTADPARTRELLENMFRNSVEHGQPADDETGSPTEECTGDRLTVRIGGLVSETVDGDGEGFFVEDDGCGLPEEAHRVFESGFTTNEEGTGLGLAISERIAEAHGWEVHAVAGESGGARFEFRTS